MSIAVSVITVVLNDPEGLEQTIRSVPRSKDSVEYIVIDGDSEEETKAILDRYKHQIDNLISEPDSGIYEAMNKGIRRATGKYIVLLNAGDTFTEGAIDSFLSFSADISGSNTVFCGDSILVNDVAGREQLLEADIEKLDFMMSVCHQATFIPKNVYNKWGYYDTTYRLAADFAYLNHLKNADVPFVRVPVPLCRFHSGGASDRNFWISRREVLRALKKSIMVNKIKARIIIVKQIAYYYLLSLRS